MGIEGVEKYSTKKTRYILQGVIMKRKICADVAWNVPKRKTPIAYSTIATRDAINCVAENGDTLLEVRQKFDRLIYDAEAIAVLDEYIRRGFGAWIYYEYSFRKPGG
jgi:hypothetical protein